MSICLLTKHGDNVTESQKKGGLVRAKVLSPTARRAIATAGAQARWAKADPARQMLPERYAALTNGRFKSGKLLFLPTFSRTNAGC